MVPSVQCSGRQPFGSRGPRVPAGPVHLAAGSVRVRGWTGGERFAQTRGSQSISPTPALASQRHTHPLLEAWESLGSFSELVDQQRRLVAGCVDGRQLGPLSPPTGETLGNEWPWFFLVFRGRDVNKSSSLSPLFTGIRVR